MSSSEQGLSRRERKKRETRERLLTAAWDLFQKKGFDATTVAEITEAADVAKGTFFNYFASKEAMLGPLAGWRMHMLEEEIALEQGAPQSALARITILLRGISQSFFPHTELTRRIMSMHMGRRRDRQHHLPPLWSRLVGLIEEAQAQGEIRADIDAMFVARLLPACGFQDARRRRSSKETGFDIEQRMNVLLEGLAGPKWRSE